MPVYKVSHVFCRNAHSHYQCVCKRLGFFSCFYFILVAPCLCVRFPVSVCSTLLNWNIVLKSPHPRTIYTLIYIYIYIHAQTHTHKHTRVHTHTHTHTHTHIYIYIYITFFFWQSSSLFLRVGGSISFFSSGFFFLILKCLCIYLWICNLAYMWAF